MKSLKRVIFAISLGLTFGHYFKLYAIHMEILSILFINVIKMVAIPLVFFSVLNGMENINDINTLGRVGIKAVMLYMTTTIFAVLIGLIFAILMEPGKGLNISVKKKIFRKQKKLKEILITIIPSNIFKSFQEEKLLQIVLYAFFLGFALISMNEKDNVIKMLINALNKLSFRMMSVALYATPYGVFSIISWTISEYRLLLIAKMMPFIYVITIALTIQYVLFGLMILCVGVNPMFFFKKMIKVQFLAFAISSSKGVLMKAIDNIIYNIGVSKRTALFVLPLGAAINMDATSIYLGVCSIFFSQVFAVNLCFCDYLTLLISSTIGSIGAAGIPGGSVIMLSIVLSSIGLPIDGVGIILSVDKILEMPRTMINITGDCTITLIIDKIEGQLNKKLYYR